MGGAGPERRGSREGPGQRGGGHSRGRAGGDRKRVSGTRGQQLLQAPTPARMGIEKERRTRPSVHCSAAHSSQTRRQPKRLDRGMERDVARKTTEYCSAVKAGETTPFAATWTDPEMTTLSVVSQRKCVAYT